MKDSINLLPVISEEEKKAKQKQKLTLALALGAFVIVLIGWAVPFFILQNTRNQQAQLDSAIATSTQNLTKQKDLIGLYTNVVNKTYAVEDVFQKQRTLTADLENVKQLVGSPLELQNISIKKNKVTLTVSAFDLASIMAYIKMLEDERNGQKFLKDIIATSTTIDKTLGYQVKIEATLVP